MKNKFDQTLSVALHGMNKRNYKMMVMYLQGPCKGKAQVVDDALADIDIIDADFINPEEILQKNKNDNKIRPAIILSLKGLTIKDTFLVKKPVQASQMIQALNQVAKAIEIKGSNKTETVHRFTEDNSDLNQNVVKKQAGIKNIDQQEKKKVSKHRTAMNLSEGNFTAYIGHVEGINFFDRQQALGARFDPKSFYLGYVLSALKAAREHNKILQLNTSWKPLVIFPHSHEVWLDANDHQLRAFAGIALNRKANRNISLSPIDRNSTDFNENMENFYDVDAFLWKIAVWTSKGRYPENINIDRPVYLKHWPNFTRLIITPHALQISALLIHSPKTLVEIIETLKVRPEFVFVFISAAQALDLIGQADPQQQEKPIPAQDKKTKPKGVLGRILSRLRR